MHVNQQRVRDLDIKLKQLRCDMIFGFIWFFVMAPCGGFILYRTEKVALGWTFVVAAGLGVIFSWALIPEYRDLEERKRMHTGHEPVV